MILPIQVKTLKEIENNLDGFPNSGRFIYRGLSSNYTSIKPSLYYKQKISLKKAYEIEYRLINCFINILDIKYNIDKKSLNPCLVEIWLIARHFSLASRFVEFSSDFLVALQFSFKYASETNSNAYLWVLIIESNTEINKNDSYNHDSINPFALSSYRLLNPSLLLTNNDLTKLAYDRMFIQNSIFLLQPLKGSSSPISEKISQKYWKLFEIPKEYFIKISDEVKNKYSTSLEMELLIKPHQLDDICKELNRLEKL